MTSTAYFKSDLDRLPEAVKAAVVIALDQWDEQLTKLNLNLPLSPELSVSFIKVWVGSQYVSDSCIRYPQLLIDLVTSKQLFTAYSQKHYAQQLAQLSVISEADLMQKLRYFRRQGMVRIAWRDLAGWAPLSETLAELSWLADACIQFALAFLYQEACELRGIPLLSDGSAQQIIVLGMGKLGAYELNYSSDIDLIFAYPENGVLSDRKATSYSEFFTRLCQRLVKVLDESTVDGFVFRTDIRLRPFGDSGPVIMSFEGMENYYQTQAREWERYAMIKARQVAGDFKAGAQLMAMLSAFVYRRYLDYGAFAELRALKMQINQELRRKDRLDNIKLGPGGIRECEFIGQAFQLIRGGTDKSLQVRPILEVLSQLSILGLLPKNDAEQLMVSYCFLRRVENHIQQYQDQQTHDLPITQQGQLRLVHSLDYTDWATFKAELDRVREAVQAVFEQVFSVSKQTIKDETSVQIWTGLADAVELETQLTAYGFKDSAASLIAIQQFKSAPAIRHLTTKGAQTLERLMPPLITALQKVANPDLTLKRLLTLFEAVAGRNVYLALLAENADALAQLVKLVSGSAWVCDYLALYPVLFDELLDPRALYEPLKRADLDAQLVDLLKPIAVQDVEQVMIVLRQFKHIHVLKVAAADIMAIIPIMVVSDYLTYIAESIVAQVIESAWLMLVDKHGTPPDSDITHKGFAVLGFGKLGGIELAYGSDLDLVFIYDCPDGNALTLGDKPISCTQFYGRLGLKVRQLLDTKLLSGVLYDVDLRLRPHGESGLLVSQIHAFEQYLRHVAWTWEHQALVRGRFIAGDLTLKTAFESIRSQILSLPRELSSLKAEVCDMREKMRLALATKVPHQFDLKHSQGGIVDIEFMVQFRVLASAASRPELMIYTDNVRLLAQLEKEGFFTKAQVELLTKAYCTYRDTVHRLVLQGETAVINAEEVAELSQAVIRVWQGVME